MFFLDSSILAVVLKRETEKEAKRKQNAYIKDLDPLIITFHLPSMKLFFTNINTDEVI